MTAQIRIGASGWHYKHWRGVFYDATLPMGEMLHHYVKYFDTVEINNTFYALPKVETAERWGRTTPPDFCFAVKGSRFLTHLKKLKDPEIGLRPFFEVTDAMKHKVAVILFQLPPHWKCNPDRLASFLEALPSTYRYTFEFRDPSWHRPDIYELLHRHNVAFCIFDRAATRSPIEITCDFTYIRMHGGRNEDRGNYATDYLTAWAERIEKWRTQLESVFVYFNNDWEGFAVQNGLALKGMLNV